MDLGPSCLKIFITHLGPSTPMPKNINEAKWELNFQDIWIYEIALNWSNVGEICKMMIISVQQCR
jgi:hypothetical protein